MNTAKNTTLYIINTSDEPNNVIFGHANFALLFFLGHLLHGGRTIFRDVFTGIGAEVTEQVEFGAFQKLGDKSTKKQGAV